MIKVLKWWYQSIMNVVFEVIQNETLCAPWSASTHILEVCLLMVCWRCSAPPPRFYLCCSAPLLLITTQNVPNDLKRRIFSINASAEASFLSFCPADLTSQWRYCPDLKIVNWSTLYSFTLFIGHYNQTSNTEQKLWYLDIMRSINIQGAQMPPKVYSS